MARVTESGIDGLSLVWGGLYFPHHFRLRSPEFHWVLSVEAEREKALAVQAPRGSAKSTVLTFLKVIRDICFKRKNFIVIVQNTYAKAAASLETIKEEVRNNGRLKKDFPLIIDKDAEGDSVFRYPGPGWKCRVLCKGADQIGSIRGEKFGHSRPDLIVIDDLEDDEMVRNPDRRKELEQVFNDVLKYAGDVDTQIIVVGTMLHDDCLIAKLLDKERYKRFRKLFFSARADGISIWPEKWTLEQLKMMEDDDPAGFAKEMMGDPSSGIYEHFRRSDFRYWKLHEGVAVLFDENDGVMARWPLKECKGAISCDLAWEEKRESDASVILPGYLTPDNSVLIDDYISKKGMRPDEIEEALFSMEAKMVALTGSAVPIGFEKAKLEKVVRWLLAQAMRRRSRFLWLKDLKWDHDKITRIVTRLSNRYRAHAVFHKRGMSELEAQLVRIGSTAHDDVADATQGLVQLLEYPKVKKAQATQDDAFEKLRKFAIESKEKGRKPFIYGKDKRLMGIPASVCPI